MSFPFRTSTNWVCKTFPPSASACLSASLSLSPQTLLALGRADLLHLLDLLDLLHLENCPSSYFGGLQPPWSLQIFDGGGLRPPSNLQTFDGGGLQLPQIFDGGGLRPPSDLQTFDDRNLRPPSNLQTSAVGVCGLLQIFKLSMVGSAASLRVFLLDPSGVP